MIEIIREENWDSTKEKSGLPKNIRQIGSPDIGDRIYIENQAYQRMHPYGSLAEKTVYVMLGRFEDFGGRQCTFVENVIEMEQIQFDGNLPVWNDDTWSYLYRMLGHEFDEMIIVGWAIDIRGQLPNMTAPLEKLHRTYFGGTHQILFLMDSMEQEEAFYSMKNGSLKKREGYYIYFDKNIPGRLESAMESLREEKRNQEEEQRMEQIKQEDSGENQPDFSEEQEQGRGMKREIPSFRKHGREQTYRDYVNQKQEEKPLLPAYTSTFLLLAVMAALGFSAFRNYEKMNEMEETLAQMNTAQTMFAAETTEQTSVQVEDINGTISTAENQTLEQNGSETTDSAAQQENLNGQENGNEQGDTASEQPQTDQSSEVAQIADGSQEISEGQTVAQEQGAQENQTTPTMTEAQSYLNQGYYIVQQGDSLVGICKMIYQTTAMMDKLCEVNGIENPDAIYAGQYLTLPN